ncbi:MAG: LysM peptidoglycan-binding domain-containing protein [Deltaproteobacteria bacterium]|uniref:LysM peptidoglycan-binding domain-containing protein n=1 Tax=Candidatus Zymogenus saltonus TaxID=2844893 RepID=A0A9D8KDL8_9DELT|nr:LysM peptidoglycan-binding domain-containing protein [Candidatus Zymogenus saltonus]
MSNKNGVDLKGIFTFALAILVVLSALYLCLEKYFERADLLYLDGAVETKRPWSNKWIAVTEDTKICRGSEIKTGDAGTVELELPDDCFVKVGPDSRVKINKIGMVGITKRAGNGVELIYGKVRAIAAPFANKMSGFSIKSLRTYIGLREADLGVIKSIEPETTQILGLYGEVTVNAKGEGLVVGADEEVRVVEDVAPDTKTKLDEKLKADFLREMDFVSLRAREWIRDDLKLYGTEAKEEVIEVELPEPEEASEGSREAGGYTVTKGDSLWKIAEKFYGDGSGYTILYEANRGEVKLEDLIYPGQTIVIPSLEDK